MMIMNVTFPLCMFFVGLLSFSFKCKNLLLMLMSLEFVVLSIYLMMFFMFGNYIYGYYFCLIYISMMVCESVLGLAILVIMVRSYGNDFIQSLNILW